MSPNFQTYFVTATHSHPDYQFQKTPVRVMWARHGETTVFWADHPKLGCGKNYPNPDLAIRGLFSSHGCVVTLIKEALGR